MLRTYEIRRLTARPLSTLATPSMFYMSRGSDLLINPGFINQSHQSHARLLVKINHTIIRGFAKGKNKDSNKKNDNKKGGKGKGKKDDDDDDDSDNEDENNGFDDSAVRELPKSTKNSMDECMKRLSSDFTKIKVGTASADMFSDIQMDGYGALSAAGQIAVLSSTSISITPYDPSIANAVADVIREYTANSINPTVEAGTVKISVPKPTKESRDNLVKMASKISEKCKTDIRNFRKTALDSLKKAKASGMGEDDIKKITKEIEAMTEKKNRRHQK